MRVLLYAKLLKETETDETIGFFVTFLSLVAFQLGGGGRLDTPMNSIIFGKKNFKITLTVKNVKQIIHIT